MLAVIQKNLPRRRRGPRILTREEARAHFDSEARRSLGMSGDEFVAAWESGKFDDELERSEVARMSMLLPFYGMADEPDC